MIPYWLEYVPSWRDAPLAYWVHIEQDGLPWYQSQQFEPAAPRPHGSKAYPQLCVRCQNVVLRFSSRAQIEEFIRVFSQEPRPGSLLLSSKRAGGPNQHWLSRLPAWIKGRRPKNRLLALVREAMPLWDNAMNQPIKYDK